MLGQRIVTAIVLLALLLPALFAPMAWPFAALTLVLIAAAGWEWGRLNGASATVAWGLGAAVALAGAVALAAGLPARHNAALWLAAAALWVPAVVWCLRAGPQRWPQLQAAWRLAIGVLVLLLAWLALAQARERGINFVLSVFALVWAADIAAYAGGRAFGRHKLAPGISPGKTWEGAYAGGLAVLLLGALWAWLDRQLPVDGASLSTCLVLNLGWLGWVAALLGLAAMSVAGDLFESLVKRAAGAKDSSGLLPGHGGVLDRIDALLPVFPCALALVAVGPAA